MAATEVISLGSSPLPDATLPAESPIRSYQAENPLSDILPSPSTYISQLGKTQTNVVLPPVRPGRTLVPPGRMGFCTASALHKENVLEQNTLQAPSVQRIASTKTTLPLASDEGLEQPKPTRKRATKKNDTPKLELDKKPSARKLRKKKVDGVEEVDTVTKAKEHTPLGDLQIFEYKPNAEKGGNEATLKPKPTNPRNSRDESKYEDDGGAQREDEMLAAFSAKEPTPLGDMQIFEYRPHEEAGGKDPATKSEAGKPGQKKGESQHKPAQAMDQVDTIVHVKENTPLGNLAVFEYVPDAQKNGDEAASKPKARKPRQKKNQPTAILEDKPQDDQAAVRDLQGADHIELNPDATDMSAVVAKVRKPRQLRKDKATTKVQAEMKAKVTKPRENAKTGKKVQQGSMEAGIDAAQPPITTDQVTSEITIAPMTDIEVQIPEDLALAPALKRRRSWTPPKITETSHEEDLDNGASLLHEDENILAPPKTFLNLKGSFGYNEQNARDDGVAEAPKSDQPVLKRRRIEVTKVPKVSKKKTSPEKKAPKPKAPKAPPKAVRTVTGIALANFQHQDVDTDQVAGPLDLHLQPGTESAHLANDDAVTADIKSAIKRKRSASPTKRSSLNGPGATKVKKSTKKVTVAVPQKLLSPGAAQKRMEKQDILFGTSSQLAREDSPSFLRELQRAIKASESQAMEDSINEVVPAMRRKSLSSLQATRKLWAVGARGDDLAILEAEPPLFGRPAMIAEAAMLPMVDIPLMDDIPLMADVALNVEAIDSVPVVTVSDVAQAESQHIDLISSDAFQDIDTVAGLPQQPAVYHEVISSPPSAQITTRPNVLQDLSTNKKLNLTASLLSLDDNKAPPSSQKGAERARSHSPKKSALFEAVQPLAAFITEPMPRKSPKRASTAPIILTSSPYHDIEDIEDSEPELTSSPPRRRSPPRLPATLELSPRSARKRQRTVSRSPSPSPRPQDSPIANSPKPASKSRSNTTKATKPTKAMRAPAKTKIKPTTEEEAAHHALLFKAITAAVTSAPPTTDLKRPSWYEKMLLYDPIVLEDLAGWLNAGVLKGYMPRGEDMVGYVGGGEADDEVDLIKPALLQKWCEENSICCLWRNGLRGGVKAKY